VGSPIQLSWVLEWVGRVEAEAEIQRSFDRAKGTPFEHHPVPVLGSH